MNLPRFSVRRPVFTTMVTLILVILGAVSLSRLQIDMFPDIELPTLTIRTDYEGASPEVMERLVTQIIEEIVATVPGVEEINSTSSEGRSSVRVSFEWGTDIDTAAIDVQGKLEDEINELPDDIVVLENIFRRRSEHNEAIEAASVEGAREVGTAIVASTITTLAIFLPLVFVRGVSGILFTEMAYVIVFSLVCSLAVALSLVPMLASKLLGPGRSGVDSTPPRENRWAAALLGASLLLLPLIGSEFLPPSDEGEVRVNGKMEIGTRLSLVDRQTRIMERIVVPAVPEAVASVVSVGASGWREKSRAWRSGSGPPRASF